MPVLNKQFTLQVTVEQFLRACSNIELQELELLLPAELNLRIGKQNQYKNYESLNHEENDSTFTVPDRI